MPIDVDIERFADHIKNHRPGNEEKLESNMIALKKFYRLGEERPIQKEPLVVVDRHGRIVCWYLPMILSEQSLVSI